MSAQDSVGAQEPVGATPEDAIPEDAIPEDTSPVDAVPAEPAPVEAAPAEAAPATPPAVVKAEPGGRTDPQFTTAPVTEDQVGEGPVFVEAPVTAEPPDGVDTTRVEPAEPPREPTVARTEPPVARTEPVAPVAEEESSATNEPVASAPAVGSSAAAAAAVATGSATSVGEPVAAPQPGWAPAPDAGYGVQPVTPVYVRAPVKPKPQSNRGGGILIVLLATLVYAILIAGFTLLYQLLFVSRAQTVWSDFQHYLSTPVFYLPVIIFALAFILLVAIVNRAGWWAYVFGAFGVAVLVYLAYVAGSLITLQAWNFSRPVSQLQAYIGPVLTSPVAFISVIAAREVPVWFGAWIAARGRKLRVRNADAQAEYEREVANGPQPAPAS